MAPRITAQHVKLLHNILPLGIRKIFSILFQWIYLDAHFFTSAGEGSEPLRLAYFGMNKARARCWAKRICGDGFTDSSSKRTWIWNIEALLKRHNPDCELVIVETCLLTEAMLWRTRGYKLPMWIQLALDSSKSLKQLCKASFRLENEIPRILRKHNLACEFSDNPDEVGDFIEHMYLPFIGGRHGENAFFSSLETINNMFLNSELIYVTRNGTRIAGVMLNYENNMATLRYSGLKDNSLEYYKTGCIGALYYFGLLRAMEKGAPCFNFGGSSPFLTDNITYFKLSFKPYVMENTYLTDNFVKMSFRRKTPALTTFLQKHPFITSPKQNCFERHVFIDADKIASETEFADAFKKIQCDKLEKTIVHVQGDIDRIRRFVAEAGMDAATTQCEQWIETR